MSLPDIALTNSAQAISLHAFDDFFREKFKGIDGFQEFYLSTNGGFPEKNTTRGAFNETISLIYPIKYRALPKVETIEEINHFFRNHPDMAPFFRDFIIFGVDDGGNVWCVGSRDGMIYYVPHDMGADLDRHKRKVAENFREFLGLLEYINNIM